MKDPIAARYRNISGTILVINDLDYLEIGINEIIDLSAFPEDLLKKSIGLREHIALSNLMRDNSNNHAHVVQLNSNMPEISDDLIEKIAKRVSDILSNTQKDYSNTIKEIASEIGKQISANINIENVPKNEINEYEENIINENINRINRALDEKYKTAKTTNDVSEKTLDEIDSTIPDLKNILSKDKGEQ